MSDEMQKSGVHVAQAMREIDADNREIVKRYRAALAKKCEVFFGIGVVLYWPTDSPARAVPHPSPDAPAATPTASAPARD